MEKKTKRTFDEIYEAALARWPEEIDISDGYNTRTRAATPKVGDDGFYFETLSTVWDRVESDEDLDGIMDFKIFHSLHMLAVTALYSSKQTVMRSQLDTEWIKKSFEDNLSNEDWEESWAAYDDPEFHERVARQYGDRGD